MWRTAKTLIRLGGCPDWSESLLGAAFCHEVAHLVKHFPEILQCFIHNKMVAHCMKYSVVQYEPPHDKTNKMTLRPAKTQISLGIRPVWSVFAVRMKQAWVLSGCPDWSESSLGAHTILLVLSLGGSYVSLYPTEPESQLWKEEIRTERIYKFTIKIKKSDIQKICCNQPEISTRWLCRREMWPKNADGTSNSVDPDQEHNWADSWDYGTFCPP